MRLLFVSVLLCAITPSVHCAEKETKKTKVAVAQVNAAMRFLELIADGQLDLERDTAISKNCSPKRRSELEILIERERNHEFKEQDILSIEAQLIDSKFAAVLVRADNTLNPLDIRMHAVALLKLNNQWVPAPLLGSFSNTGYGYAEETEKSVKKLEAWMTQQKKITVPKHIQKIKSQLISKITKINQTADLDGMNMEQLASYFLKQCRDKNTLAILASMGAASSPKIDQLYETLDLITRALQLDSKSTTDWHYLSKACVATVVDTDEKTGKITVGCFDPKASEVNKRYAHRIIELGADRRNGRIIMQLPKELNDLGQTKRRKFQRLDQATKDRTTKAILKAMPIVACKTPEELLDRLFITIDKLDFHSFLALSTQQNKHTTAIITLDHIAQLWNKLIQNKIQTSLTPDAVTKNQVALTTITYQAHENSPHAGKEEVWMIKNDTSWNILPKPLLRSTIIAMVGADERKVNHESMAENLIAYLRQQIHNIWLKSTFDQVMVIELPLSPSAPSVDKAQKTLAQLRKHLLARDMTAYFSQSCILENSDRNILVKRTERLIRGAHDQLPDIQILGISERAGWVGISAKTRSKLSELYDYPLYLFATSSKGPLLFANADFRYPRNSGRRFLNEQNWALLETSIPAQSITILKTIFNEHLQRCDNDMKIDQN